MSKLPSRRDWEDVISMAREHPGAQGDHERFAACEALEKFLKSCEERHAYVYVGYHSRPGSIGWADHSRGLTKPQGDVLMLTDDEAEQSRNHMSGGGVDLICVEEFAR